VEPQYRALYEEESLPRGHRDGSIARDFLSVAFGRIQVFLPHSEIRARSR
jgi:hypothetical protein